MVKHAMPSTVPNKRKHQAAVTRALLGGTGGTFSSSLFLEPKSRRKNQAGIRKMIRLPLTDLLYDMDMDSNNRGGKGYGSMARRKKDSTGEDCNSRMAARKKSLENSY